MLPDLPGRRRAFLQWWGVHGGLLHHRPDLVLVDYYGRGTFAVLDVKTFDVAGVTHLDGQHTHRTRRATHDHEEDRCRRLEYRVTPQQPLPPQFRLTVFAVSTFGSLGSEALTFLTDVGRRFGRALPPSLLPQATWAAPALVPFARMAVSFAVRRGLAQRLYDRWRPGAPLADGGDTDDGEDWGADGVDDEDGGAGGGAGEGEGEGEGEGAEGAGEGAAAEGVGAAGGAD